MSSVFKMPAISDTLRKLNPWHKGKYLQSQLSTAASHLTTCSSPSFETQPHLCSLNPQN